MRNMPILITLAILSVAVGFSGAPGNIMSSFPALSMIHLPASMPWAVAGEQPPAQNPPEAQRATLTIVAANADGAARGTVELYRSEQNKAVLVATKPLVQGKAVLEVPPGTYTAVVIPTEETPRSPQTISDVTLSAGDAVTRQVYFPRGKIAVAVSGKGGDKVDGAISIEIYDQESRKYSVVPGNILLAGGQASFYLPPGSYRLRFTADGIIGAKEQASEIIKVEDKSSGEFRPVVEFGFIKASSAAGGAPLKSHITVWSGESGEAASSGSPIYSRDFDGAAATLKIAPGKYHVAIEPDRGVLLGAPQKNFDKVEIAPGGEKEISAAFERGHAALTVGAFEDVCGRVDVQRWREGPQNYSTFDTTKLKAGVNDFFLAPGKYRIVVVDTRVTPEAAYEWADIQIADKSDVSHSIYLERGRVSIVAANSPKAAGAKVIIERKNGDEQRRVGEVGIVEGHGTVEVRPGKYRLTYQAAGMAQGISTEWFDVKERAWLTRVFDAGADGASVPPEVDLWGPYEVGDQDALLEAGERMTFSTRFGGPNFAGAKITLLMPGEEGKVVEKQVAEITKAGVDAGREEAMEKPGEYILRIVAWDSGNPRKETVIERKFTVRPQQPAK